MIEILSKIDKNNIPQHVAVIMDGNGRWAKKRGMTRVFGHQNALEAVRDTIGACEDLDIPFLTLYAFSSENWNRPEAEVGVLMNLLVSSLKKELKKFNEKNIRLRTIGETDKLPKKVYDELQSVIESTKNNTKGTLIVALSYGAKDEIIRAVKNITKEVVDQKINIENITEDLFEEHLYTKDIPAVDLMIRTSGETRISNFMLWQIAYAELYFTDVLWPDFRKKDFFNAIVNYQKRERRFGQTSEQISK